MPQVSDGFVVNGCEPVDDRMGVSLFSHALCVEAHRAIAQVAVTAQSLCAREINKRHSLLRLLFAFGINLCEIFVPDRVCATLAAPKCFREGSMRGHFPLREEKS